MKAIDRIKKQIHESMKSVYGYDDGYKQQTINETNIYSDKSNKLFIGVFVDQGRQLDKDPYFKVSWKAINNSNHDVARISMSSGDYVIHYKRTVVLDTKTIKKINEILPSINKSAGLSVWDSILLEISQLTNADFDDLCKKFPRITINPTTIPKGISITRWG